MSFARDHFVALDHVQIAIPAGRDDDARKFYGELLGLKELEKPAELRARGGVWFVLPDGRQVHLGVEHDFRPAKKGHPCFVVEGDLDRLAALLSEHGYDVQHDNLSPPVRRLFTHDVFGNRLDFADRMSGS